MLDASLLQALESAVGADNVLTDPDRLARHAKDWSKAPACAPLAVVRPGTTTELSRAMAALWRAGQPMVPQGGLSGLAGGATPQAGQVAMSLERMTAVEEVDREGGCMVVQAGVTLQAAQLAASDAGFLLPLDLGARGSATIGGTISTNAGGMRVLRWGMMREMVLGLEAVLADGTVLSSMGKMLKNNAGYDLKHLFIGSEGTLGIVTRAVLRLRPAPRSTETATLGCHDFAQVTALLETLSDRLGGTLSTFEVMWRDYHDYVTSRSTTLRPALDRSYPFVVLAEALGSDPEADAERFQSVLADCLERGLADDAVIAASGAHRAAMFAVREDVSEPLAQLRPSLAFDVSMAIADMPAFDEAVGAALRRDWPRHTRLTLGHVADGNLHLMISVGSATADAVEAIDRLVYDAVGAVGGSISAEHGIGTAKRAWLDRSRSAAEIAVMRQVKAALDPKGLLNPGKVI